MSWDRSVAGRLNPEGKPFKKEDGHGQVIYDSRKGAFTLGQNVVPDYVWFDGTVTYTVRRRRGNRRSLQSQVRFRAHRDAVADHPHGRAQGEGGGLRPVPQLRGAPEGIPLHTIHSS
jgi:hypothetical protein